MPRSASRSSTFRKLSGYLTYSSTGRRDHLGGGFEIAKGAVRLSSGLAAHSARLPTRARRCHIALTVSLSEMQ
jgi:hypothetical protein